MPLRVASVQQTATASGAKSRHLLRALLREASYLPDAHARSFFHRYILTRFKVHQPASNATSTAAVQNEAAYFHGGGSRRSASVIEERSRSMQKRARKGLNYLQRANQGHFDCLEKILMLTYGRIGPRRYLLLEKLLQPDSPESSQAPSPLQRVYYSSKRFLQFFDAPQKVADDRITISISDRYSKLKAVVVTQRMNGIGIAKPIRSDKVKAPAKNVWQRPMPMSRARNIVRKWYADTMGKLLPPLPPQEWDELRAYATGEKVHGGLIARRTPVGQVFADAMETSRSAIDEGLVLAKPSLALKPGGKMRPHDLTPRFMQRMYWKIFSYSCKLEWSMEHNRWSAVWGGRKNRNSRASSSQVDEILFAGVDTRGRPATKARRAFPA